MPEKVLEKLKDKITPVWKACFICALVTGFLAHFYKITNWIPNWDGLVFRYDVQNMTGLGRWLLSFVCYFTSFYDLPFLNGVICIFFHALGAVYICRIIDVKQKITAALIGALVVSFPTVTSVMMYSYVADGYGIAFFLSCVAAYLMVKEKPSYFWAAIFIALSSGIYQAYITVTIMLVLLHLLDDLVYGKVRIKFVLKDSLEFLVTGFGGMALYFGILYAVLTVTGTEMLDYQGISSSANFLNLDIMGSFYRIKTTFIEFFFDFEHPSLFEVLNEFILVATLFCHIRNAVRNRVITSAAKVAAIIVGMGLLIVGSGVLALINASIDYHSLMLMGYCIFYMFFIILYEREEDDSKKIRAARCWMVLIIGFLLVFNNSVIANVSYHKAQMAYEKSYGTLLRIADRMEQTDGIEECDEILVVGHLENSENYSSLLPPEITGITDGYIIRADDEVVKQSVFCSALNDYCGKDYTFIAGDRKKQLLENQMIKEMNTWPHDGCVQVLDGVAVIKLGSEN